MGARHIDDSVNWDEEYRNRGIPSSWREEPSSVVLWALDNLPRIAPGSLSGPVLDVGCGTGRNTIAVAERLGVAATGIDYSDEAIAHAQDRLTDRPKEGPKIDFKQRDVRHPLPFRDGQFGLAMDVFVYFHLLAESDRHCYREELARVLRPDGAVLLSLAESNDGYYASCPVDKEWTARSGVPVAVDKEAGVGNIMHSLESLIAEWSSEFDLYMAWRKSGRGPMHGMEFDRVTLATLWRPLLNE
jgi:SAM-dependent methyltransferase